MAGFYSNKPPLFCIRLCQQNNVRMVTIEPAIEPVPAKAVMNVKTTGKIHETLLPPPPSPEVQEGVNSIQAQFLDSRLNK